MSTQDYLNFLHSDEFAEIMMYTDEEIAGKKFSFLDKLFPLTHNLEGDDSFIISVTELRNSSDLVYAQKCMLMSLDLFLNFFKISDDGTDVDFLTQLVPIKGITLRIIRSLMYHELYVNANLFAFRLEKFRLIFKNYPNPNVMFKSMWELEILSCISELEYFGIEYKEPSISKKY